jgi:hypothetical protein
MPADYSLVFIDANNYSYRNGQAQDAPWAEEKS